MSDSNDPLAGPQDALGTCRDASRAKRGATDPGRRPKKVWSPENLGLSASGRPGNASWGGRFPVGSFRYATISPRGWTDSPDPFPKNAVPANFRAASYILAS